MFGDAQRLQWAENKGFVVRLPWAEQQGRLFVVPHLFDRWFDRWMRRPLVERVGGGREEELFSLSYLSA
jgi:hypothetical protein